MDTRRILAHFTMQPVESHTLQHVRHQHQLRETRNPSSNGDSGYQRDSIIYLRNQASSSRSTPRDVRQEDSLRYLASYPAVLLRCAASAFAEITAIWLPTWADGSTLWPVHASLHDDRAPTQSERTAEAAKDATRRTSLACYMKSTINLRIVALPRRHVDAMTVRRPLSPYIWSLSDV